MKRMVLAGMGLMFCLLLIQASDGAVLGLIRNTFLGGTAEDTGFDIVLDADGSSYVMGVSNATWGSPRRPFSGGPSNFSYDVFVAKLDADDNLLWNTFLGGSAWDSGLHMALDTSGNVYVTGDSYGGNWGAPIRPYSGNYDVFVAKLDGNGDLLWNTLLGGSGSDISGGVAVDASGNLFVSGQSASDWGVPFQPFHGGASDAFVAKLDGNGYLLWNTLLGGPGNEGAGHIAVNTEGALYVVGASDAALSGNGNWGSPIRPYAGLSDAFVAKLDANGSLQWNTFLGGSTDDSSHCMTLDSGGNVLITGSTGGTWGSPIRAFSGTPYYDAFVAKLDGDGVLLWNTFLGGSGSDFGNGIELDASDNIYASGPSSAAWGSPNRAYSGGYDAYVAGLDVNGNLLWNTFLGGAGDDLGTGIAMDTSGNFAVTGISYATWGTPIRPYVGDGDAFAVKLAATPSYLFSGFEAPIDNPPVVNNAKAGSSIPVKWKITDLDGTPVSDPASFVSLTSYGVSCGSFSGDPADAVEEYSSGASGLQYLGDGYWQFNWKTLRGYAGQCRIMVLKLADGREYTASFKFK